MCRRGIAEVSTLEHSLDVAKSSSSYTMLHDRGVPHAGAGDVVAKINYFPADGTPIPNSAWKKRYLDDHDEFTRRMIIRDVCTSDTPFDLDQNGFQFLQLPSKIRVSREDSEDTVKREYYPELEGIVKRLCAFTAGLLTGASTAYVFNHVMRAHSSPADKGILDAHGRWQDIPAGHPHVDYAGDAAAIEGTKRELNFPPHIAQLFDTSTRFAFLGAWRPLRTVHKDPLAVCDATTVPDSDYQVRLPEQQQHAWYYMSEMEPHSIVVFKGFDTKQEKPGWRCPHTAFALPDTNDELPRESIEARIVCFWA
ncbi:hypothetical protein BDW02DRAFT_648733 [Decorospora gaudefroyi]|uniref:GA4 desaturase family protein n=1 Tax=Decorospora gaudefroyi TaxID=184978 RepID=A0A6A5K6X3_9PLEO|nr:hypothetical protein BDW02DRAFT_648733 [Decorospora gaudefroyi]